MDHIFESYKDVLISAIGVLVTMLLLGIIFTAYNDCAVRLLSAIM